jgi:hypothetical protein
LGADTVADFSVGEDLIVFLGPLVHQYSDLELTKTDSGTRIVWEGGSADLIDVDINTISETDFVFLL